MTITKYDRFAILPRRCDWCNRLFVFEPYNVYYKDVALTEVVYIRCKDCCEKVKK